jgi:hypothetical protein
LGFKLDVFGTIGAFFLVLRGLGSCLMRQWRRGLRTLWLEQGECP